MKVTGCVHIHRKILNQIVRKVYWVQEENGVDMSILL